MDGLTSGNVVKLRKDSSMTPVTLSPENEDDDLEEDGEEERDENIKWNKQTSVGSATDTGRPVIQSAATRTVTEPSSNTSTGTLSANNSTTNSRIIKLSKKSPSRTDPIIDRYIRFNTTNSSAIYGNCNDGGTAATKLVPGLRSDSRAIVNTNSVPSSCSVIKSPPPSTIVTTKTNNNNCGNNVDEETSISHRKYHSKLAAEDRDDDSCDEDSGVSHKPNNHHMSNGPGHGYANSHTSSRGDNYLNYDRSPDHGTQPVTRSSSHHSYRRSPDGHYEIRNNGGDNTRDYDRGDSNYRKESTSSRSKVHEYSSSRRYDDGDVYRSTRTYKYYDDDEIMDRSRTSDHRTYDYNSESQSQQYKSSSSRVHCSYDYKYDKSSSHSYRDRDSPGPRTISPVTVSKKESSTSKDVNSKLNVRSYGDWDELLSATSNKKYYYNRVTKKSQWSKPEEIIELESRSKYYDKYGDRSREEDKYRDKYRSEDKYYDDDRYRDSDKYRDANRSSRVDDRYKQSEKYRDDRYDDRRYEDTSRTEHYKEDDRKDYYHRSDSSRSTKYQDLGSRTDRYDDLRISNSYSARRTDDYDDSDSEAAHRRNDRYGSPRRSVSRTKKHDHPLSPSSDHLKKDRLAHNSTQETRRRSPSNHRDDYGRRIESDYDRVDKSGNCDGKKHSSSKATRNNSVQMKSSDSRHGSIARSSSISPPSETDSKSDHFDDPSKVREKKSNDTATNSSKKFDKGENSHNSSPYDNMVQKRDNGFKNVTGSTVANVESRPSKRKRSQTPTIEDKRSRTTSDSTDTTKSMTPFPKKFSPPDNQKTFDGLSLSPSQVSLSNLREIIDHFSGAPEMSELQKMNEGDALKTIHQMLRLIKKSHGGHLQQQLTKNDSSKSNSNSPVVKSINLNSVQRSNSKLSSLNKSKTGERSKSIYDNLKKQSNEIKDDLNRLLPSSRTSAVPSPSESSDSCSRSPRNDVIIRSSRGLLSSANSSVITPSTKSNALSSSSSSISGNQSSSITPSLVACFKEDLITHVQGWSADNSERQAKKYADEAHNLGSLNCTRVSAELKMARSLVRLTEIQATLQEQRILFVRQLIKDVDERKGNQSANAISLPQATTVAAKTSSS